jgi:peroxiredoxin Q/BCP
MAGGLVDTLGRGPRVGEKPPDVRGARDQNGEVRNTRSLTGRRGLILQFYRPMVLCPTCEIQAGRWSARAADFRAIGYEIAAVSNDAVDILSQVARRRQIDFPLLSDPDSRIIRAFGLIDDRYGRDSAWHGVALPMIFVIDRNHTITHRFSSPDFRERPDVDAVLKLLRKDAEG